jgi:formylmethanofuran dehydrogenase subunit A
MKYDLCIRGGLVVDPAERPEPAVGDVWIADGRVAAPPRDARAKPARTIDARGYVVMPGGVDVHCHIAGAKVNAARAMRPEDHVGASFRAAEGLRMRSGATGSTPSTFATGPLYAGLGYTTAVDAAIPPLGARLAHMEFADTPLIDKAMLVLLGNNHFLMDAISAGDSERTRDAVAWWLRASRAFGVKVVNPGGVERWKQNRGRLEVATLDDPVDGFGVTPRLILTALADAVDALGLPHPIHLHGLNLGMPGCAERMLETLRALDGRRAHLAHVQFHSYGPEEPKTRLFGSGVEALADYINGRPGLSVDVGQVVFGETTAMTADGAVGHFLARLTGRKWVNVDIEQETGCGVVPVTYSDRNAVHALQWAIGLEWFLRIEDPWRVALSTDHPNGGSFLSYPAVIALLMDRGLRAEALAALPEAARARTRLGELTREYSLAEIAIVTRAAPARMLGMTDKGRLGPGADADVTVFAPDDDKRRMFSQPRYVVKSGVVILDDGEFQAAPMGRTYYVEAAFNEAVEARVRDWFEGSYSLRFSSYALGDCDVTNPRAVATKGAKP